MAVTRRRRVRDTGNAAMVSGNRELQSRCEGKKEMEAVALSPVHVRWRQQRRHGGAMEAAGREEKQMGLSTASLRRWKQQERTQTNISVFFFGGA